MESSAIVGKHQNSTPEQVIGQLMKLASEQPAPAKKRALIYIRKSRILKDEEYYSPKIQETTCRKFAQQEGLEVIGVIKDLDRSGSNSDRAGFQRLLGLIKAGELDYVLVQYLDREFRNGISFIQFYDFIQKYGVQFLSVNERLDTRSFTGRFMLFVLAVAAELPVWTASERSRQAKKARREAGKHNGGYRLGYCNGLCSTCADPNGKDYCPLSGQPDRPESQRGKIQVPHPVEQQVIRLIAYSYAKGMSSREISNYLNNNKFKLPDGLTVYFRTKGVPGSCPPGNFSPEAVQGILRSRFYVGFIEHFPTAPLTMQDDILNPKNAKSKVKNRKAAIEIYPGVHEAIYPHEIWEKNQGLRDAKGKTPTTSKTPKRIYMLSGIARCWECTPFANPGAIITLRGTSNGSGKRIYRCALLHGKSKAELSAQGEAEMLAGLNLQAIPTGAVDELVARHQKTSLPAEHLEAKVDKLVAQLVIPESWHENILAYFLSLDGPAEFKRRSYNLRQEMQSYKTQHLEGVIDAAELRSHTIRIGRELNQLSPQADPRARALAPLLGDFPTLWTKLSPGRRRTLLGKMFDGLYFDSTGQLVEARAHAPFDKLLMLAEASEKMV